jgi:MFS family permease
LALLATAWLLGLAWSWIGRYPHFFLGALLVTLVGTVAFVAVPAFGRWYPKNKEVDLTLQALTPLSSPAWISGRIAAATLVMLSRSGWIVLLGLTVLIGCLFTPLWVFVAPAAYALVVALVIGMGSIGVPQLQSESLNPASVPKVAEELHEDRTFLTVGQGGLLVLAGVLIGLAASHSQWPWSGWVALALSLLCLPLPPMLMRAQFRRAVKDLDLMRLGIAKWT